jgi:hypothetical protein
MDDVVKVTILSLTSISRAYGGVGFFGPNPPPALVQI